MDNYKGRRGWGRGGGGRGDKEEKNPSNGSADRIRPQKANNTSYLSKPENSLRIATACIESTQVDFVLVEQIRCLISFILPFFPLKIDEVDLFCFRQGAQALAKPKN